VRATWKKEFIVKNKLLLVMLVCLLALVFGSCASINITALMGVNAPGSHVFHARDQVAKNDLIAIQKTGELTSKLWLGFIGEETFPTVAQVAKENGITKIASVEYKIKPGILCLWVEYTTSISGE
jgi:hypothetical protein